MGTFRPFAVLLLCTLVTLNAAAHAQETNVVTVESGGCQVRVRTYTDTNHRGDQTSRYTFDIIKTPPNSGKWDFTLDSDPAYHYGGNLSGGVSPTPYGAKDPILLHATLHQYETLDEPITFPNLTVLTSSFYPDDTAHALLLTAPLTVKTPSGISVTLPPQDTQILTTVRDGNREALFIRVDTTPANREVVLPASPLFQKYHKPVTIHWESPEPSFIIQYTADNTFKTIGVSLPNLKTLTHLDTLTLILRQRVELQSLPLVITLPPPGPEF